MRRVKFASAFTIAELLVSVAILIIITLSVAGDIGRTQFQAELSENTRLIMGELRNLQARALAATAVQTCDDGSGKNLVCESDATACIPAGCSTPMAPVVVGLTLATGGNTIRRFAEVDPTYEDRRDNSGNKEWLGTTPFLTGTSQGAGFVTIQSLLANGVPTSPTTVTFDRQSGNMRINPCGTPPMAPACPALGEPTTLEIRLVHSKTNQVRTVRLNGVTGKISIE